VVETGYASGRVVRSYVEKEDEKTNKELISHFQGHSTHQAGCFVSLRFTWLLMDTRDYLQIEQSI
jgi:hypothetical protein